MTMTKASTMEPKYDMRVNPVYQIDFSNVGTGKRVCQTKRRIRWRFGFSNKQALAEGRTGTNCRSEEHEVTLIWTLVSGKRVVTADGQEVHFSQGKVSETMFETSWTMAGGHLIKIVAHAIVPNYAAGNPGFRQFDLLLDGCSFFDMPKIFELGTPRASRRLRLPVPPTFLPEEPVPSFACNNQNRRRLTTTDRALQDEHQSYSNEPASEDNVEAHDFAMRRSQQPHRAADSLPSGRALSQDPPQVVTPTTAATSPTNTPTKQESVQEETDMPSPTSVVPTVDIDFLSDAAPSVDILDSRTTAATHPYHPTVQDEFSPVEPQQQQQASFALLSNQILSAYAATTRTAPNMPFLAMANEPYQYNPQQQHAPNNVYYPSYDQQSQHYEHSAPQTRVAPFGQPCTLEQTNRRQQQQQVIVPTMKPLSIEEIEATEKPALSAYEKAIQTLVNLDDITETVKVTPEQLRLAQQKLQKQPTKSKPLPPTAPAWHLGSKPALRDLQQHKPSKTTTPQQTKPVMRTHAFDPAAARAGMMVLYGTTTATSIPAAPGFGAGLRHAPYHLAYNNHSNQYYQQPALYTRQQQQQPHAVSYRQTQLYAGAY